MRGKVREGEKREECSGGGAEGELRKVERGSRKE